MKKLKDILQRKLNSATTGEKITLKLFHVSEKRIKTPISTGRGMFFSDKPKDWLSPFATQHVYQEHVTFHNPLVVHDWDSYIHHQTNDRAKKNGHDGIIFLPHHPLDVDESVHFYPEKSIKNWRMHSMAAKKKEGN